MSDANTPRPGDLQTSLLRKILNVLLAGGGGGGPWEPKLGYTPENVANKAQSLDPTSVDQYPSSRAVGLFVGTRILGAGTVQLVDGAVHVPASQIKAGSSLQLTHHTASGTLGHLSFVITEDVGFDIISSSATDQSSVDYIFTSDVS